MIISRFTTRTFTLECTISACDLTKYEIAVTGTQLNFSMDRNHYKINKLFTKFSGCIDIGMNK